MLMRNAVKLLIFVAVILLGLPALAAQRKSAGSEEKLLAKAQAIHQRVIPLDTHVDVSPQLGSPGFDVDDSPATGGCRPIKRVPSSLHVEPPAFSL